jgi:hypothetical protein
MASELLPFDHSTGPRTGSHRRLTPYVSPQVPSDLGQQCMPAQLLTHGSIIAYGRSWGLQPLLCSIAASLG